MKPNILLITADQWRGDFLGVAGHPVVKTPHTDALAAAGVYFARHYAQAVPCSPSRACLYTGLYQMNNRVVQNGTPLDRRHDNLATLLRAAGYAPTLFGYTDQTIDPRTTSADDPALTTYESVLPGFDIGVHMPAGNLAWQMWMRERGYAVTGDDDDLLFPADRRSERPNREPSPYGTDETPAAFLTGEFLRWFRLQQTDRPWCAHLSLLHPHPPFHAPAPYNTMYDPADGGDFARAADAAAEAGQHPLLAYRIARDRAANYLVGAKGNVGAWADADFRTVRATYWGMISEVDAQIGRIVEAMKAGGAWDNTVIILTSDHGEMMGDHWSLGKFGYHEASYHVPLVVRVPDRSAGHGRQVDAFSESVDVLPTLLEVCGAVPPDHLDGRSLVPFLDRATPDDWRDAAHHEFDFRTLPGGGGGLFDLPQDAGNLSVLRTKTHKYVHFAGLPPLLFDLGEDPGELVNRAGDPAFVRLRMELAEQLLSWRARHLDRRLSGLIASPDGVVACQTLSGP